MAADGTQATPPQLQGAADDGPGVVNAMSVDVEEYFQVGAFEDCIARDDWDGLESRVELATGRVLDLFAEHGVQATFFTLGWIAERHPRLIARIVEAGHELASHGYAHHRVTQLDPASFRDDIRRTRKILEDAGGVAIRGYRAPSFSIGEQTTWALEILAEEGYAYSSSIYPIRHDHYGMPDAPRFAFQPYPDKAMIELPVTTVSVFGRKLPCGGGGYFRLLPYALSRAAMRRVNRRDGAACIFYFHPWELDPDQPRQHQAGLKSRFRHYTNQGVMAAKLARTLRDFRWDRVDRVFLDQAGSP